MTRPALAKSLAFACARACDDKKASGIVVLDIRKISSIADYFVVASVSNDRQARAIAESCRAEMKALGVRQLGIEGLNDAHWVLQDFGDVVLHLFNASQREFYDIEGLWADAKKVRWQAAAGKS